MMAEVQTKMREVHNAKNDLSTGELEELTQLLLNNVKM